MKEKLAIYGGSPAVTTDVKDTFTWPIVTKDDEDAVLEVLRNRSMSGQDVTKEFEKEYAKWQGKKYTLGFHNGTAALQAAMFGCNVGVGDEIICPSITYWASLLPVYSLGGTVVFADIDKDTLCIDPNDIEHRVGERTKAIVVVHYVGHPCDMDPIMAIAKKHNLKVIEDVSHAHGAMYKGRKLGSIGHVSAMSLMSGKALAVGEAGMMATDDKYIYEKAIAFGHYTRNNETIETEELKPFIGLPLGGYKYRMHQMSAAMGRVQLKAYDKRCIEIRKSMNYFWDLLEGVPGIQAHRVDESTGSTMGGWYSPHGLYKPEELGGLSVSKFTEALRAEGVGCTAGLNMPLHKHPLFQTCDVYGHGKPTRIANSVRDVRLLDKSLSVSEMICSISYSIPWFKKFNKTVIEEHANAFKKVALNYKELLADDKGNPEKLGGWHFFG